MSARKSILVIDDEAAICLAFQRFFEARGWEAHVAASAGEGLAAFDRLRPCVVFLDVRLPDRSGLDVLEDLRARGADVIVITAYGGLETAVRALHGKAFDYLVKPLDLDKALAAAERVRQARAGGPTAAEEGPPEESDLLVGRSPPMQEVYKRIARAAASTSPVLIQGATGTGKEVVAQAIHRFSPRRGRPFVAVNCGAMPENLIESELFGHVRGAFTGAETDRAGRFESASGGTLLLDEVGELPPGAQVKLLRVLDSGVIERVGSSKSVPLDVRVLASTNRDLGEDVRSGRFRQDLYYRLAVLEIALPPLRDRREDILPLAEHFLARASHGSAPATRATHTPPALGPEAAAALLRHDWPGNVRELKNAIEHATAVAPGRSIALEDLPESIRLSRPAREGGGDALGRAAIDFAASLADPAAGRLRSAVEHAERALILHAMKRFAGNQSEAADFLGLHRNTLRNKLRELHIEPPPDPR